MKLKMLACSFMLLLISASNLTAMKLLDDIEDHRADLEGPPEHFISSQTSRVINRVRGEDLSLSLSVTEPQVNVHALQRKVDDLEDLMKDNREINRLMLQQVTDLKKQIKDLKEEKTPKAQVQDSPQPKTKVADNKSSKYENAALLVGGTGLAAIALYTWYQPFRNLCWQVKSKVVSGYRNALDYYRKRFVDPTPAK